MMFSRDAEGVRPQGSPMPIITPAYLVVIAVPGANPPGFPPLIGVPPAVGHAYPLLPAGNVISREPTPGATIVLPWWNVSRRQTQIDFDGQSTWDIQDLSSRNGTCVNGQQLQPYAPWPLCDGDRIQVAGIAGVELRFTFHPVKVARRPQALEAFLQQDEFR